MTQQEKITAYTKAEQEINAILEGETFSTLKMATINCILRENLSTYFWVGFYLVHGDRLVVGPYQGTLGCLHISYDKGVCGRAAREQQTQIVQDVHADPEHIACDSRSNSEIVVPVLNGDGQLIAVFDVDSTEKGSFDQVDQEFLERILATHFKRSDLVMNQEVL